jgi:hypothetical protein
VASQLVATTNSDMKMASAMPLHHLAMHSGLKSIYIHGTMQYHSGIVMNLVPRVVEMLRCVSRHNSFAGNE